MSGFESASTATLVAVRENLLHGLDVVADSVADGTFAEVGLKGSAPPAQSGHLTLALLDAVDIELALRAAAERVAAERRKPAAARWYRQPPYQPHGTAPGEKDARP